MSGSARPLVAVAAVARNNVIGHEGGMPWRLPTDLRRYRALTIDRPMIMGRRTLESIGRVLDGRDTIVLSRRGGQVIPGAIAATDVEEALRRAETAADKRGANEIVIAGGAEIYRLFWSRLDRLELTVIEAEPAGDTFFPLYADGAFERRERTAMPRTDRDSADAWYETWVRSGKTR